MYGRLLTPPGTPLVTGSENDPIADASFISAQKGLPNLVRSLTAIKTTRVSLKCNTLRHRPIYLLTKFSWFSVFALVFIINQWHV